MSNIYAGALGEIGALLGGDVLLQDKFKSTDSMIDLVMNQGYSPEEAENHSQQNTS